MKTQEIREEESYYEVSLRPGKDVIVGGIDPGIRNVGVAMYNLTRGMLVFFERLDLLESGGRRPQKSLSGAEKTDHTVRRIKRFLEDERPEFLEQCDVIAIEHQPMKIDLAAVEGAFLFSVPSHKLVPVNPATLKSFYRGAFSLPRGERTHAYNKKMAVKYGSKLLSDRANLHLKRELGRETHHVYDALILGLFGYQLCASADDCDDDEEERRVVLRVPKPAHRKPALKRLCKRKKDDRHYAALPPWSVEAVRSMEVPEKKKTSMRQSSLDIFGGPVPDPPRVLEKKKNNNNKKKKRKRSSVEVPQVPQVSEKRKRRRTEKLSADKQRGATTTGNGGDSDRDERARGTEECPVDLT